MSWVQNLLNFTSLFSHAFYCLGSQHCKYQYALLEVIHEGQSLAINQFVALGLQTSYVVTFKIIHLYFYSHDLFNELCDLFK